MKIIPILLLLLLAGGCAKSLQPDNYADRIATTILDVNTFLVSYPGSTTGETDRIVDLTLLKSADTALAYGFNYFIIVKTREPVASDKASDSVADQVDSYLRDNDYAATVAGGVTYLHATPGVTNTIVCFTEKPQGFSYIALILKATLRGKYNMNQLSG